LRVLIVEDSPDDALLLELELRRAGYQPMCQRVEKAAELSAALDQRPWQAIIADYVLPSFSGLDALRLVKARGLDVPFIIVSGHITENTAVAAMKAGAHDYVMKNNLARLGPAIDRELQEAGLRRERRAAELRLAAEHGITRLLAGAPSLPEAAPGIVEQLLASLEAELGQFWTPAPNRKNLVWHNARLRTASPALERFIEADRQRRFPQGSGLPGRVWDNLAPAWIQDVAKARDFRRRRAALGAGLRGAVAFPLQSGGTFFGVLEFFSARPVLPAEIPLGMLAAIGSEIGQFAHRRQAEEALRRAHDELEVRVMQRTAQLKAANSRLEASMTERRRLEHELLELTEKERRRIGLDLHDDLGQKLSGVALMTKGLQLQLAKNKSEQAGQAARIHQLVQEAMSHASDLAHDLATLDSGSGDLKAALEQLTAHGAKLFKIQCRFRAQGDIPSLETNTINQLYKIAQEALTNAIKHGKAKRASIELVRSPQQLVLKVINSGLPFPDLRSKSTGMGLRIMNYRANLVGASLDVRANGTDGTVVTCILPVA
jgi:signal transduction histidine kinase/ActR/RegA family two-component response regulator